ncbi:MAG: GNAT family N-acetyltransferase [Fretibacterium sp.]|nr:GNAT family N-acetyltransferase [Fretibacterium sp.]
MKKEILQYDDVCLIDIKADKPDELDGVEGGNIRAELPANAAFVAEMTRRGYVFGDRTICVSINLLKSKVDYRALSRFEVRESEDCRDDVLKIAVSSFPTDRRFHIRPELDSTLAAKIIESWVGRLKSPFVCLRGGQVMGFLCMERGEESATIALAAVDERFRAAGVGLSLYAGALNEMKGRGCKRVEGRISSVNTPVMNLYAFLGASFSNPRDIYLREVRA